MRRKKGWMNLKIAKITEETWDTKTFYFIDADDNEHAFDYIAGQYLTFRYDGISDKPIVRSYTMSSSPCEKAFSACTIKRVEGGLISNWMCDELKEGDILKARGPIGRFVFNPEKCHKNLVMVGAGSGVTPFISILREYADCLGTDGAPETMTLLVAYRSKKDLICWDVLESLQNKPGIKVITTLTREDAQAEGFWYGRPSTEMLDKAVDGQYDNTTFLTCGPEALMTMVVEHAISKGVEKEHAQTESFF
ncbi:ferredoxin--NADP reductase [Pseudobacteriovorax antillogorgiicola]|nr:FAD-binding oxidoreductase [Pseudobacteriovorax antillogorgiicola]